MEKMNEQTIWVPTQSQICRELVRELKMRRKIWPTLLGLDASFISISQQRQYDLLEKALHLLDSLNQQQWNMLVTWANSATHDPSSLFPPPGPPGPPARPEAYPTGEPTSDPDGILLV